MRRRWVVCAFGVVVLLFVFQWRGSAPVSEQVARVAVSNAVDSASIVRLASSAVTEAKARDEARSAAVRRVRAAARARRRGDSLAAVAEWKRAYEARTAEALELLDANRLKDTALVRAVAVGQLVARALAISEVRVARMDSLVRVLGEQRSERCRIAIVVPCPSRSAAVVVGMVAAAGALLVVHSAIER